jgi:nickel/cobalt transporter (NicO) family protein
MIETFFGVILLGLFHGLEPGHGWPVAALYSLRQKRKYWSGLSAAIVIAFFHFVSSIAVVLLFIFADNAIDLSKYPIIRYIAAALLFYLAYRFWTSHDHGHADEKNIKNLWGIAVFAFILGFAHEEEFALLAFCIDEINCLALMASYAAAVSLSIIIITILAIRAYQKIEHKMHDMEHYLPKISAAVLVIMALLFLARGF